MMLKLRRWLGATLGVCCGLGVLVHSGSARGEARTHDGFYLQLAMGGGFVHSSAEVTTLVLSYEGGPYEPSTGTISYSGVSAPFSLLLGGTLGKRVVVGGGFF